MLRRSLRDVAHRFPFDSLSPIPAGKYPIMTKRSRFVLLVSFALLFASLRPSATAAETIPNVLFCIADDASPTMGAYGTRWVKTPNIDRIAERGIVFENAYTPTAKCAPSRAATLTGRNPWQLEEGANHQSFFPANYGAFTEVLASAGRYVGAQGKFWGPGDAKTSDGKARTWGLVTSGGESQKDDGGAKFKKFLEERPNDVPFFYWFGSTNPHRAYELDSGLQAGKKPEDIDHVPNCWPDNDVVRRDMLDYAIEVELYDKQVGSMIRVLEESGEFDNTLIIITSDHGMPFPRVKGHNYHASNHIPFIACWTNGIVKPGRRVEDFVSLISVAPTVLEAMHVENAKAASMMKPITGMSLMSLFRNESNNKLDKLGERVILGRERNDVYARPGSESGLGYPVRGIRRDKYFYLVNFKPDRWPCGDVDLGLKDTDASPTKSWIENAGSSDKYWQFCFGKRPAEELYDLSKDPDCTQNLIGTAEANAVVPGLKQELFDELTQQNDPRILGRGDIFDNYPTAKRDPSKSPKKTSQKKK